MLAQPPPGQILSWLGGDVTVRVEMADDGGWFDISEWVLAIEIDRGSQRWGTRYSTGTMKLTVDNTEGYFTQGSSVDVPWTDPLQPNRQIRAVADDGDDHPLFTGTIEDIADFYGGGGADLTAVIQCADFMAQWSRFDPLELATPTGRQRSDERVHAALDRYGWPDDSDHRDIQQGFHGMQSSYLANTTLEECQKAADAEGGAFFCSKDGKATFKARDWLITDQRSVEVQAYLSYSEFPSDAYGFNVEDVKTTRESIRIRNQIGFARVGGRLQDADDADSIAAFGGRGFQITNLENDDDDEVLFLAQRYLATFKDDRLRVDEVVLIANEDPDGDGLNAFFWEVDFGDLVDVNVQTLSGWSLNQQVHVRRIRHVITGDEWKLTLGLDAQAVPVRAAAIIVAWPSTEDSIPEGWVRETRLNGRYPKGAEGQTAGAVGGSSTHTHTTSGHVHAMNHSHSQGNTGGPGSDSYSYIDAGGTFTNRSTPTHVHSRPNTATATVNSQSNSPGLASDTDASSHVPHKRVIFIRSVGVFQGVPNGAMAFYNSATAPAGWSNETSNTSSGDVVYLRGANSGSDGSLSYVDPGPHTHRVANHTHAGTVHNHGGGNTGTTSGTTRFSIGGGSASKRWPPTTDHYHPFTTGNTATAGLASAGGGTSGAATHNQLASRNLAIIRKNSGSDPSGLIVLFLGHVDEIPVGWKLCDGTNGTPDMRGRYPRGVRSGSSWGSIGSAVAAASHSHTTPGHTHSASGSHRHTVSVQGAKGSPNTSSSAAGGGFTNYAWDHVHTATQTNASSPDGASASSGVSSSESPEPPFRTVHFLMKE